MKKGIRGIGSASMLLIFTVLCMAVFSLISLSSARTDSAMTAKWKSGVMAYYKADLLAEHVLAAILSADEPLSSAYGVEINNYTDIDTGEELISFYCTVDEDRRICVSAALNDDGYDLREWRLQSAADWSADGTITLWPGE